jgi:hypothetical protein
MVPMSREEPAEWTASVHTSSPSVPPPYHDEWSITLGADGDARLDYRPDYHDPTWTYTAPVDPRTREAVRSVVERLAAAPPARAARSAVGGGSSWARATLGAQRVTASAGDAAGLVGELFRLLRGPFDDEVWADIAQRRGRYIEQYRRVTE